MRRSLTQAFLRALFTSRAGIRPDLGAGTVRILAETGALAIGGVGMDFGAVCH